VFVYNHLSCYIKYALKIKIIFSLKFVAFVVHFLDLVPSRLDFINMYLNVVFYFHSVQCHRIAFDRIPQMLMEICISYCNYNYYFF
jgi:hypothetical protein